MFANVPKWQQNLIAFVGSMLLLTGLLIAFVQVGLIPLNKPAPEALLNLPSNNGGLKVVGVAVYVNQGDEPVTLIDWWPASEFGAKLEQLTEFAPAGEGELYIYIALEKNGVEQQLVIGPVEASFSPTKEKGIAR